VKAVPGDPCPKDHRSFRLKAAVVLETTFDRPSTSVDGMNKVPIKTQPQPLTLSDVASLEHPLPEPAPATISIQVDGEAAEHFIAEKRIGERIKYLRLKKSMGLVDLGRHTGLSASFLSQLETGRVVPTLRNLARIAMVFSKDLNFFFEPEPQTLFRVHRAKDRVRLPQSGVADPAYFFESLGYQVPDRQLDPYFAEFLPKKPGREPRAHQHVGCEFLYLLSGQLDVQHGEVTHHVDAGDAIYFDATTIHSYQCRGELPATALIVTLQQPAGVMVSGRNNGSAPHRGKQVAASAFPAPITTTGLKRTGL
jgi:transcriptional regulator with XRE-family HTH domain